MASLLAACVLTLLVVAPTVGMAACVCDRGETVTSLENGTTRAQDVRGDQQDHDAPCDAACCVGGHCHHGGGMLDAPATTILAPTPSVAVHTMTPAHALASHTISGLERPPRV